MKKREIKFRVWNGETMISPDYITRDGIAWWKENSIPEKSNNIMQFTGIKIKDIDCYEGDIIQCGYNIKVVEWEVIKLLPFDYISGMDYVHGIRPTWTIEGTEIIGNIYENPELIGKLNTN